MITFIMKAENLDFSGAADIWPTDAGIYSSGEYRYHPANAMPRKGVYEINLEAARFFRTGLDPKAGVVAMDTTEGRGTATAVIRRFGWICPDSFDLPRESLKRTGVQ